MGHGKNLERTKRTLAAKDTSITAAQYQPGSTGTEYHIKGNPGLVLVVLPPKGSAQPAKSERVWRCRYSITRDGVRHQRRVRLGTYPATTLAAARATAAKIMAEVDQGGDPFVDRNKAAAEKQREQLTFADLVDDYLAERHELASASEIERELRKDAVPVLGKKRPSQITPADIDQLASKLLAPGRNTKVMARRLIQRLKALFNYALLDAPAMAEKYGITMNPAASVGRRRPGSAGKYGKPEKRTRVLTDAEIGALWRAMSTSGMRQATQLALKLVLVTAQRTGELRIARKAELHLDVDQHPCRVAGGRSRSDPGHHQRSSSRSASQLTGNLADCRDCHVVPDLVLLSWVRRLPAPLADGYAGHLQTRWAGAKHAAIKDDDRVCRDHPGSWHHGGEGG